MALEIRRLHLASVQGADGRRWPVHGFVVTHPGGAVLVDTGVGGPQEWLDDWRVVNRSVADALAELDMSPADIGLVINTHLHFDHCGQNAVFKHAPVYVQRAELSRAERESPELYDWFDFMNARWELLDGDVEVLPGLEVIATPGHTEGHQCVVVRGADAAFDLLIGDAAYTPWLYARPDSEELPPGQASDVAAWRDTVRRIHSLRPAHVHFCHHTDVVHSQGITVRVIAGAGTYTPPDGSEHTHWIAHLESGDLSVGTYSIPMGGSLDDQTPHTEDEIYVVQSGRATLVTGSGTAEVGPGSVVFVPAMETHRFTEILEDLAMVVIFAPPYGSRAAG